MSELNRERICALCGKSYTNKENKSGSCTRHKMNCTCPQPANFYDPTNPNACCCNNNGCVCQNCSSCKCSNGCLHGRHSETLDFGDDKKDDKKKTYSDLDDLIDYESDSN